MARIHCSKEECLSGISFTNRHIAFGARNEYHAPFTQSMSVILEGNAQKTSIA